MTVNKKMTAIADAIRSRTRETEKLSLDDMASGVNDVYDVGYSAGHTEGYNQGYTEGEDYGMANGVTLGKSQEYNRFWDAYQQNGNRTNYTQGFSGYGWTDETFKPKYPIIANDARYMFAYVNISNINVRIYIAGTEIRNFFERSTLKNVQEIVLTQPTVSTSWMSYTSGLEEIRITCEGNGCFTENVACTVNTLSHDSLVSIINALQDLVPLGKTFTWNIGSTNKAKLTTAEIAVATEKGWTVV